MGFRLRKLHRARVELMGNPSAVCTAQLLWGCNLLGEYLLLISFKVCHSI